MSKELPKPPRWADYLLEKLCRADKLEEVQGDLHESFLWRLEENDTSYAKWQFVKEMILSIRITNLKSYPYMNQLTTLFSSHIKTGWRFLWKTKTYSAINILGLSIGIVFSWFAYQYATDQVGYNKHLKHVNHLHRLSMEVDMMGTRISLPGAGHLTSFLIKEKIPEVTDIAVFKEENTLIKLKDATVEQRYLVADYNLIDYLSLSFVEGHVNSFRDPYQAIISEQMAYKLGIRGNAVNQIIELKDSASFRPYKIIGVYEEITDNTSIKTDIFIPYSNYLRSAKNEIEEFMNFDLSVILRFTPESDVALVKSKIKELIDEESGQDKFYAKIQPIATLHLEEEYLSGNGFLPGGNSQLIWFIAISGLLCLIISIINYANFSISLYINRAREVAVRKIMGSARIGVFQQLMTESFLTTLLAACLSVVLFILIAPQFSEMVEKKYDITNLMDVRFIPGNILIIILISFLSGLYPSFLLSRFNIIKSLKGVQKIGKGKTVMQSLLVVQFSISIIMIACMLMFKGQLNLLTNYDKGFDVDQVVRINLPSEFLDNNKPQIFLDQLGKIPFIINQTAVSGFGMNSYKDESVEFGLLNMPIDSSYIEVLKLRLTEGTDFRNSVTAEASKGVIVNEAFLRKTGIIEPIGKVIPFRQKGQDNSVIVGVVKDYYMSTPKREVEPVLFYEKKGNENIYNVLLKTSTDRYTLEKRLETAWNEVFSPFPLDYDYLSDEYDRKLNQEAKISRISGTGSIIAIFIAAFGLLGLVGLTIRQKMKEVSIRRVLGANITHISGIVVKRFLIPIGISLVLGLTLSFYIASRWLEDYHVRIDFGWEYLTISALSILGILLFVTLTQVNRIVKDNPVVHLKDD